MKRTQLLVLSVLALGLQGVAQAGTFPADADASYNLPAAGSYSEQSSGGNWTSASSFPADADASNSVAVRESYAERHANEAVRTQSAMAFGAASIDD
jgi:hypothetical protein